MGSTSTRLLVLLEEGVGGVPEDRETKLEADSDRDPAPGLPLDLLPVPAEDVVPEEEGRTWAGLSNRFLSQM